MSADEIRERTQGVWDGFYSIKSIWTRSNCVKSLKARVAFVLISKLYRQMYAKTGISTDNQEFLAGVVCVAVSVANASDRPIAALAISAPIARMSLQQALKYVPSLRGAAARLSETIVETERPPAIPRRKRRGRSA